MSSFRVRRALARHKPSWIANGFALEMLEPRTLLAADLAITEFVASNDTGLADAFGANSDWIEIQNRGTSAATLSGLHLTNNPQDLAQWTFPAGQTLGAGEYLIVFASGRDAVDAAGSLHTNFRLDRNGDYLALVDSDLHILSEYSANGQSYPQQLTDVSYGQYLTSDTTILASPTTPAQLLVPTDNGLGATWTDTDFNPTGWQNTTAGIGYDRTPVQGTPLLGGNAILNIDFGDDDSGESGDDNTEPGWTQMTLSDAALTVNGIRVTINSVGGVPLQDRDRTGPADTPPSLTFDQIYDDLIFASSQTNGTGLEVHLEGLAPGQEYEVTLWSFDSGSPAPRVSDWTEVSGPEPVEIESSYTFNGSEPPTSDFAATMSAKLTASATGELRIQGVRNGGTSFGVFLNAIQVVAPTLAPAIQSNIADLMPSTATSALLRVPFPYPADFVPDQLNLKVAYDSGFVAYLNGAEVARRNAPATASLPFDATASSERTVASSLDAETIDISSAIGQLHAGENILAIHALTSGVGDLDFLLNPELSAVQFGAEQARYFSTPTPGAENVGETFLGVVDDTRFSIDRGFYSTPQSLTISSDTPGSAIIYTLDGSRPTLDHGTRVDPASSNLPPAAVVPIANTTYVRAMAVRDEYLPSNVDTQTYIFLDDVVQQTIEPGVGDPAYPKTWQSNAYIADYNMDPEVVAQWDDNNPANEDTGIRAALLSIPTMSIVLDHQDLWNSNSGIYPKAQSQGTIWQRAGSLEYMDPATGEQFQVNAGVQMHGGASRDNERTKKHSFRLLFNERFDGPSELNFPLFNDSNLDQINTFVLKSFFTDGFPTRTATGRYSPLDSQYMRDTWMRDMRLAMGGLDAHSEYVHLYINGLYWGLYSPTERPDDAFMSSYLGGDRDDYDIVKDFTELFRGNMTTWSAMMAIANGGLQTAEAYQKIQGNNPDGTPNPDLPNYLDVDDLIDYMILHLYSGAEDWPHHNWYAARDRVGETTGFRFFTWDQEIVLDGRYRDRTDVTDVNTPARLYSRLRQNEDFRLRFADRVYLHLFNDGALTTTKAQEAWMRRANQIEAAIIAESARWGDAREGEVRQIDNGGPNVTIPVMTVDLWRAERDNVRDTYFAKSLDLAIQRFTADKLFPTLLPPHFAQRGGLIDNLPVVLSGDGELYYTLDGTDPRELGGGVSAGAVLYTGPFHLPADATVTVRAKDGAAWSAVDRAAFEVHKEAASSENLRMNELHYHPANNAKTEFIELQNIGAATISLTGVRIVGGVRFDFSQGAITSLEPGQRIVIVENQAAFAATYPDVASQVAGEYLGSLSNGGDSIQLLASDGTQLQQLTYDDDPNQNWPTSPDGHGPSLLLVQAAVDCVLGTNCYWRPSAQVGGSPGAADKPVGDANLDGIFNSSDIVTVFQAGKYELHEENSATWAEGDWNGDGQFTTGDLVFAFQFGQYFVAARPKKLGAVT